jgi:hypothetical protein
MRSALAALVALALAGSAGAKTVYVANDGLDGADCGTKGAPCRSITQGIAQAAAGDTVSVGPGRYGDLDADGMRGEPGEEAGAAGVVDVDESVRVYSSAGADATVIEATDLGLGAEMVRISAPGAVFGKRSGGFTILLPPATGVGIQVLAAGVTVAGNEILGGLDGIRVDGTDSIVSDNRVALAATGIAIFGGACTAARNSVIGCEIGLRAEGIGCVLDANALVSNDAGLLTDGSEIAVQRTLFAGNRQVGASLVGGDHRIESSSFFGNGDASTASPNCAVSSESALNASGNYWGSPLGPGHDPADLVCNAEIASDPFAKKAKTPRLKPTR